MAYDFVGRSVGITDDMQNAGDYWGRVQQRRQQMWQDREARTRYDEANRANREVSAAEAASRLQDIQGFDGGSATLAGLQVRDIDPVANPMERRLAAGAASAAYTAGGGAPAQAPVARSPRGEPLAPSNTPAYDINRVSTVRYGDLTNEQRAAWNAYVRAAGGGPNDARRTTLDQIRTRTNAALPAERAALRATGLDLRNGELVRVVPGYSREAITFPGVTPPETQGPSAVAPIPSRTEAALSRGPEVNVDLGAPGPDREPAPYQGGMEPADAPRAQQGAPDDDYDFFMGVNDTSAPLELTPRGKLVATQAQRQLQRAEIYARHGQLEQADAAHAQALVLQAEVINQVDMQLYNAARGGSRDALSVLLGRYAGYPPGTFQIAPTDEDPPRFVAQRLVTDPNTNQQVWRIASSVPVDFQTMLASARNIVDAAGAQADREAANEYSRALIAAGAQRYTADASILSSLRDNATAIEIARIEAASQMARDGRGQVVQFDNGDVFYEYPELDPETGRMETQRMILRRREVNTPDVDGNETEERYVGERIVGMPGLRTN